MAEKYKRPSLCNCYCSQQCPIGQRYVPFVTRRELPAIILEMLASLNAMNSKKERLIEIAADGKNFQRRNRRFHPYPSGA